jgi:hypothetical protein
MGWVFLILMVFLVTMFFLSHALVGLCTRGDDEGIEHWHEQSKDTGTDFMSMATAFLLVFFFRWLIIGEPPKINGELGLDSEEAWKLLALGFVFLGFSGAVAAAHHFLPEGFFLDYLNTTVAISAAFLLIFALMWKVGDVGESEVTGQTLVAFILVFVAVFFMLFIAAIREHCLKSGTKALKAIETGLSLAVGLSWEKVFDVCMEGLGEYIEEKTDSPQTGKIIIIILTIVIVGVVVPAWALYILPKASVEIQEEMSEALKAGPLPLRAILPGGDRDLYNNEYDGVDSAEETLNS